MVEGTDQAVSNRDLASAGALVGNPARAAILAALADGRALPAGELARRAGISPATATTHLRRLIDGGLITVHAQGRHRYHELAGAHVAVALEALAQISPPVEVRSLREHREQKGLAQARTCYDHLAGARGVELRDRLIANEVLLPSGEREHVLTEKGRAPLQQLGLDLDRISASRRMFARTCIDWTHRRPHLAGALPAALTARIIQLGWMKRTRGRALLVTPEYREWLDEWLPEGTSAAGSGAAD